MTDRVAYPGCYCADCVEGADAEKEACPYCGGCGEHDASGWPCSVCLGSGVVDQEYPSARITGDKGRGNPAEGAPRLDDLRSRLSEQECCIAVSPIGSHPTRCDDCPRHVIDAIDGLEASNRRLAIECRRLRHVLRWIEYVSYADSQSGHANFEFLQGIARDALRRKP